MKTIPAALQSHIAGESTTLATLFRLTTTTGAQIGFTTHDETLTVDGLDYEAVAGVTPSQLSSKSDLSVDNLDFVAAFDSATLLRADLLYGVYDYARLDIYLVNWADVGMGVITLGTGVLGEVSIGDTVFRAEMRSLSQNLQTKIGRVVGQECDVYDFGDERCGANKASFQETVRVDSIINEYSEFDTDTAQAAGYYTGGTAYVINGDNAGQTFQIARHSTGGIIKISYRTASPVIVGVDLILTAGCDRRFETCKDKFSNEVNFRGFPHVPGRDSSMETPNVK